MVYVKEYRIKKIFSRYNVSVPNGLVIGEKDRVKIPWKGDVAVKAQVPFSSRYKKGFIWIGPNDSKRVSRACRELFQKMKKDGYLPQLLIEKKIDYEREFYIALVSDPVSRGPLLLFSRKGGVDIEKSHDQSKAGLYQEKVDILKGLDKERLKKIFKESGLNPGKTEKLIALCSALYEIYRNWHCCFIELNPVVETKEGFFVLDAKVEIDEDGVQQLDAKKLRFIEYTHTRGSQILEDRASQIDAKDYRGSAHFVQTDVNLVKNRFEKSIKAFVGFNAVGTGVGLTAMDELVRCGFFPRNFCDTSGNPPASKIYRMTKIVLSQDQIRGYFFISCVSSQQLNHTARGIIKAFKEIYKSTQGVPQIPSLLLFRGAWDEEARNLFDEHGITKGNKILILGRESSERDAARKFAKLFEKTA